MDHVGVVVFVVVCCLLCGLTQVTAENVLGQVRNNDVYMTMHNSQQMPHTANQELVPCVVQKRWPHKILDRRRRAATDSKSFGRSNSKIAGSVQSTNENINAANTTVNRWKNLTKIGLIPHSNVSKETATEQLPSGVNNDKKVSIADTAIVENIDKQSDERTDSGIQVIKTEFNMNSKVAGDISTTSINSSVDSGNVLSTNMTVLMKKYAHKASHAHDVTSATLCVSAVLILLFGVVLYSRMWKKRDQWLTLEEVLQNQAMKSQLPQHGKISIKDLVESKLKFFKAQLHRLRKKTRKFPSTVKKNGLYKQVHQVEDIGDRSRSGSEDELYAR